MNIDSFQVWNFKSIDNSKEIHLPRITLLIGPNSSGKSSIFQSLLLMKQTFEAQEPSMPLVLNGPHISLGEYSDFIHNKDHTRCFCIKFNFELENKDPYECEVCNKTYKNKKRYLKHVENAHQKYWNIYKDRIVEEQYHLPKVQSVKLRYSFDSKTSIIRIDELEYENPPVVNGLLLSSLKISQNENKIQIKLISRSNKIIYSKIIKDLKDTDSADHLVLSKLLQNYSWNIRTTWTIRHHDLMSFSRNEKISVLDRDLGNVLKLRTEKEVSKAESNQELGIYSDTLYVDSRSLTEEERLAFGIELRLFRISRSLINRLNDISNFLDVIHHVGPLRNWPERVYFGTGGKPTSVGGRGEYTQEILWLDKRIGHENLIKKINDWLFKLKFDIQLEIDHLKGDMYQLRVIQNGLSINAADVGFGISQILPILTECLDYSTKKLSHNTNNYIPYYLNEIFNGEIEETYRKMVICQQPEIHLNPRIQSELGDFFTQIDDPNLSLLIETHSEHILTRLQRRVADGTLDPNDIAIYFISREDISSEVKKLSISKKGEFDYWPEGFFQDDYEDTIEILKASLKHQEGE